MIIATAQLHSSKPELRFCTGSNPARGVLEIRYGEDLWQWSRLEIRLRLSPGNHTTKTIHHQLRISVIRSSQWNMSLVRIFWVIWRKVMHTREVPDFWGLHKNLNCAFPLCFGKIAYQVVKSRSNLIIFKTFIT